VLFNGANDECVEPLKSTGGLRGFKRMLYEGGIRAPFIARMPGKIAPGTTSDVLTTSVDFMPTAADLAGVSQPSGMDGISILPTLLGQKQAKQHDSLYFEIYEPYFQQSLRMGDWKGYRLGTKAPLELYDLKADPAEKQDIAAAHPEIVKKIEAIMLAEHTPSPHYDAPEQSEKGKKKIEKKGKKSSLPELLNEENPKP
jgi:arylsulfatase A-like enzyme